MSTSATPPPVHIEDVRVVLDGTTIIRDVTALASPGEVTGVIGPNGSGKSTLLRTVYRHLAPQAGRILVGDTDLRSLRPAAAARLVAAVPQERESAFDVTVREVVALGRLPHQRPLATESDTDRAAIAAALAEVGLDGHAERLFASLSGGERQRALLARCLAQGGRVFVLDEPTNHLDVNHQVQLLGMLRRRERTVLITMHDLNAAASTCDRLHVLFQGEVVASGPPEEVLTPALLRAVFGVHAAVLPHPLHGGMLVAIDHREARETAAVSPRT